MSLVVEDFFWQVPVFFINGCSAGSCDFGVPIRGDELWLFLLHHLGHSLARKYFDKSLETKDKVLREPEQQ